MVIQDRSDWLKSTKQISSLLHVDGERWWVKFRRSRKKKWTKRKRRFDKVHLEYKRIKIANQCDAIWSGAAVWLMEQTHWVCELSQGATCGEGREGERKREKGRQTRNGHRVAAGSKGRGSRSRKEGKNCNCNCNLRLTVPLFFTCSGGVCISLTVSDWLWAKWEWSQQTQCHGHIAVIQCSGQRRPERGGWSDQTGPVEQTDGPSGPAVLQCSSSVLLRRGHWGQRKRRGEKEKEKEKEKMRFIFKRANGSPAGPRNSSVLFPALSS